MEITPEIIATKIFEIEIIEAGEFWEKWPKSWYNKKSQKWSPISELPTFKESEWTGPLLAKVASIGEPDIYKSGDIWFSKIWDFDRTKDLVKSVCENKSLNYAIAEAILEAMEK